MSNSEEVFQQNYLPQHIRKEIMPIIFGPEAAGTNEKLYAMIRRATMKRDPNAPIYPTIDEVKSLESRRDIQELKQEYLAARDERGSDDKETKRAYAAYFSRREELVNLLVEDRRREYFAEADKRRALGQSTNDLSTPAAKLWKPRTHTAAFDRTATHIGCFLSQRDLGGRRRAQIFSELLLSYLRNQGTKVEAAMALLEETKKPQAMKREPEIWTCLLCLARFPYRGNLTRHNTKVHFLKGTFDEPFSCPQCDRLGKEKHMVDGVEQWSNHVERCHGILHTPCLPSSRYKRNAGAAQLKPTKTRSARCLVCEGMFYPGNSFARHFNKEHGTLFQEPFPCFECRRQGSEVVKIDGRAAWMEHVAEVHKRDGQTMVEISEPGKVLRKRKREECDGREGVKRVISA
ncbi:uncharacterized protein P884DRAFT_195543 [Thermothelomyces heterothallicus CBS 202.75]|uniref:uncharacterized protein n=1 Tax=Thermothelomyces heterothallicus CBS 202.75 TaxID=1149848 RepID=UPI003743EA70